LSDAPPGDALFELILYLVSCARLSLDEPPIYGSFRLVEGASRLIEAAARGADFAPDRLLLECREAIEREKLKVIDDRDGYREWLDGLLQQMAAEATRRNLSQAG
jgi:hypothetical protein